MHNFSESLINIKNLNRSIIAKLERLEIKTVQDLFLHFPFRYDDFSQQKTISELREGEMATIFARVTDIKSRRSFRKRLGIIEALLTDGSGQIRAVWFNQYHVAKILKIGSYASFAGKPRRDEHGFYLTSPNFEARSPDQTYQSENSFRHTARLIPIYPETKGATSKMLRLIISKIWPNISFPNEYFPASFLKTHNLAGIKQAFKMIHFPSNIKEPELARRRFDFETLFFWQLSLLKRKKNLEDQKTFSIPIDIESVKKFLNRLPFTLTPDQKKSLWEILKDMNKNHPMQRLLEGEVGSGKTIVAATAALNAARAQKASIFLAPTEVLAHQHFHKLKEIFKNYDLSLGLLTGASAYFANQGLETKTKKESILSSINKGEILILVGTHALLNDKINMPDVALLVIDEQHRFGVDQRGILTKKYNPHVLSMTATPIPRTLAMSVFGDLDLSIIKTMPENRIPITSEIIPPIRRKEIYNFIRGESNKGNQTFIICPRIEPPEASNQESRIINYEKIIIKDAKAVKVEFERLKKDIFPDLRLEMLHGKMRSAEKESIMRRFANKEFDILVSTSVVEVGVDIPNATTIVIEGAEHFGMAQLHQFRGRVGRSNLPSYCFLFSDSPAASANKRLAVFVKNFDGFALAEYDLKFRGPGELLGERQSGFPDELIQALKNSELIKETHDATKEILKKDFTLNAFPMIKTQLSEYQKKIKMA